jgi:predicted RNA-binding Zn-ribbon protein involved in translation (DUF1610 family)
MAPQKRWFAYINRKLHGPLTAPELRKIEGFGPSTDVTEADGEEFWQPSERLKEFKPEAPAAGAATPAAAKAPARPHRKTMACTRCGAPVPVVDEEVRTTCSFCRASLAVTAGKKKAGALVALDCPGCGGSVSLPEDSRTAACPHCRSDFVIVGGSRFFRFYIAPKIDAETALRKAGLCGVEAELHFIPYWRHRAMAFFWHIGTKEIDRTPSWQLAEQHNADPNAADIPKKIVERDRVRTFNSRRIDASVRAGAEPLGHHGLGFRLSHVPLRPFDRPVMEEAGRVHTVVLPLEEATEAIGSRAFKDLHDAEITSELEHGALMGSATSLVYVPFWRIEKDGKAVVVDGVDGGLIESPPVPKELHGRKAARPVSEPPEAVAVRCGSCGAEMPSEPYQVVFFCPECAAAWRLEGGKLASQAYRFVRPVKGAPKGKNLYLPLWRHKISFTLGDKKIENLADFRGLVASFRHDVPTGAEAKRPVFAYVPGWGNVESPRVTRIAKAFFRQQPALGTAESDGGRVVRCIYGREDAEAWVPLTLLGVAHLRRDLMAELNSLKMHVDSTELDLIPARLGAHECVESVLGIAIAPRMLG